MKMFDPVAELKRKATSTSHELIDAVLRWRNAHRAVARHRSRHTPGALLVELQFATNELMRMAERL
jgi:hypothetical protein